MEKTGKRRDKNNLAPQLRGQVGRFLHGSPLNGAAAVIRAGFFWRVRGYVSGNLINFAPARQKLCDLIVDLVTDALTGSDAEVFDNFNGWRLAGRRETQFITVKGTNVLIILFGFDGLIYIIIVKGFISSHIITWYLELWEAQSQTIFSASRSLRLIYSAGLFKRHVKQLIFLGFFYLISQKPKIIWLLTMATSPVTVKRPAFLFVPLSPDGTAESKKMSDGCA